ncbi:MAG: hypothetical protein ACOYXU_14865 [Nitrospirota bacterium]
METNRLTLVSLVTVLFIGGAMSGTALAAHSTCALMAPIPGGEATAEGKILAYLQAQPPTTFKGKVKVGSTPFGAIKVKVKATIKDPKDVDLTCAQSDFSYKFGIKVTVSGKAGSDTHNGTGRIAGHYTVSPSPNSASVCVNHLKLAGLNLEGVNNHVDDWIKKQINNSGLVGLPCQNIPTS